MKIIVQVAHITNTPGPVQSLAEFLKEKEPTNFYQILHPLEDNHLGSKLVRADKILAQSKICGLGPLKYLSTFFLTLFWLKKIPQRIDLAIGMNCFDTLALVIGKRFKKIDRLVFFNTDFSRQRFVNPILNKVYVLADRFAAKKADFLCCNTKRTIQIRTKEGIKRDKIIYAPNGVFLKKIGSINRIKPFRPQLVYVGHLGAGHDLSKVILALKGTKFKLFIIGSGPSQKCLENLTRKNQLEKQVTFLGSMSHQKVFNYLKSFAGFGLAPYSQAYNWTYYADPVKVKEYLACLLPVIVSDIPQIAEEITKKNLGFSYKNDKELRAIIKRAAEMKQDDYQKIIQNIKKIRKSLSLNAIYQKILKSVLV